GGFAHVVDVLFVGDPQHQHAATAQGPAVVVEAFDQLAHHVLGHGAVDLPGQFDEAGVQAVLAGFPGEVEGVDGDAVPAQAWAGVIGGEAEGFGGGGLDHLEDVDAHAVRYYLQ